jgi:hypothetical protein
MAILLPPKQSQTELRFSNRFPACRSASRHQQAPLSLKLLTGAANRFHPRTACTSARGCPGKDLLEREFPFQLHKPVPNFDIRNAEVLVSEHILRQRLSHRCILESEIQVVGVLIVE